MISFSILKRSKKSRARLGILKTPHGEIETPAMVPVATQAAVKTLEAHEVKETKSQILISNTYHLHLKPGEKVVKANGGLHKFMNWDRPIMTDSGGFQVFSLGFGRDMKMSKVLKVSYTDKKVNVGDEPKLLKITEDGVHFRSPIQGDELFIGPKESMKIQEDLGADIMFAFDECPPPTASYDYAKSSMEKTHRWAEVCLKAHKTKQALYGIVQGGRYKDLRKQSAEFIGKLSFSGFGIGGEFGEGKSEMAKMLGWVTDELPEGKPRHLLGIGYPEDFSHVIKSGIDTFDCVVPTRFARHGIAFTKKGRMDLAKMIFKKDLKPIDIKCSCKVCGTYTRSYIHHLFKAGEILGLKLLTFHNLYYFQTEVENFRNLIKSGKI